MPQRIRNIRRGVKVRPVEVTAGGQLTMHVEAGADPVRWAVGHRLEIFDYQESHGCVLLSGLGLRSAEDLAVVRDELGMRSASLHEQFGQRRQLADGVYSAPAWPADREQRLHHEQGHGIDFPGTLLIACLTPAQTGGAMLLSDTREVRARRVEPGRRREDLRRTPDRLHLGARRYAAPHPAQVGDHGRGMRLKARRLAHRTLRYPAT